MHACVMSQPFRPPHGACVSPLGTRAPPCLLGRTCHRISTEVVVWGVTETMVGASSGAGDRDRQVSSGGWGLGPLGGPRAQILLLVWRERGWSPELRLNPRAQSPLLFIPGARGSLHGCHWGLPQTSSLGFRDLL